MPDATTAAVRTQLAAMASPAFELGVLIPGKGMLLRQWEAQDVLNSLPWLKAKNMEGASIYIRPLGEHRLNLIDDLKPSRLPELISQGFEPTLVVQTSPNNYQAWLDHGKVLPKDVSTAAARSLAEKFGGDRGAADWRHFGRLAGFTNRKEQHQQNNGLYPFVRIVEARATVYTQAGPFVQTVERALEKQSLEKAKVEAVARTLRQEHGPAPAVRTIADFHSDPRYGGDLNRADLAYTVYALGHQVPEADIRAALTTRDLSKKGNDARVDHYVNRTLAKAAQQIERGGVPRSGSNRVRELSR